MTRPGQQFKMLMRVRKRIVKDLKYAKFIVRMQLILKPWR